MNRLIIFIILLLVVLIYKSKENYINEYTPDELFNSLSYIVNILEKNNIKYWLCYGTLLGAIRNNDIIPYDYDCDLGCFVEDHHKILSLNKYIEKDGYKFTMPSDNYGYSWDDKREYIWRVSIKIEYKGKIMGDIYLYQKFNDSICRRYDIKKDIYFWPKATFPTWFIRKLNKSKIRNKTFFIPQKSEVLLEYWYGPDWKIPIKAESQGGNYNKNYDYYGGYNNSNYSNLLDYIDIEYDSSLPEYPRQIKYYTPEWGKDWIIKHDK